MKLDVSLTISVKGPVNRLIVTLPSPQADVSVMPEDISSSTNAVSSNRFN